MILFDTVTHSTEETESLGAVLGQRLLIDPSLPHFIALYGDLGVGKTAFTRGLASVLVPGAPVRSPTFALVNEHRIKERSSPFSALFHFDMYRIDSEDDLDSIGFYDYFDRRGLMIAEWCEKIPYALPDRYLRVTVEKRTEDLSSRHILCEEVS